MRQRKIVITGGPGTGKTSIINVLKNQGFSCMEEVSRAITKEARDNGTTWLFLEDPLLFSRRIMDGRVAQFEEAEMSKDEIFFMDRGLPDVIAYLNSIAMDYDLSFINACRQYRYDAVYILPPWEEIYSPDEGRYETYKEGHRVYDFLLKAYGNFGYDPIILPKASIAERTAFMIENLNIEGGK